MVLGYGIHVAKELKAMVIYLQGTQAPGEPPVLHWCGTQKQCAMVAREALAQGHEVYERQTHDIPVDKQGLLRWLNAHVKFNRGHCKEIE